MLAPDSSFIDYSSQTTMTERHVLTLHEKTLVGKVYDYFVQEAKEGRGFRMKSRDRTAAATGFSKNTVQKALAERKKRKKGSVEEVRADSVKIRVAVRQDHVGSKLS